MDELSPQIGSALSHVTVEDSWDEQRTAASWRGFQRKRRRRAVARSSAAVAFVAMLAGGGYYLTRGSDERAMHASEPAAVPAPVDHATQESPAEIALHDDAVISPEKGADIDVVQSTDERLEVRVVRGKSRFRVPRGAKRRLKVVAGKVAIEVYAAEFSVAHYEDATDVWAHQGEVVVLWNDEPETIEAGEHRRFEIADEETVMPPELIERDRGEHRKDWREYARDDRFDAAYEALRRAGEGATKGKVSDLLLAADVFRMSGHPREAVSPLNRVVDDHASDPRAPLAAFTLGRVLLDDLGQPGAAARAFRRARELNASGALAEDALAREVEAWSKAGQENKARQRAKDYLRTYPNGHRAHAVKRYSGL